MPPTYKKAFSLDDNPFGPTKLLTGVSKALMSGLLVNPLRIADNDRLFKLYADTAGPFRQHLTDFKTKLAADGYVDDPAGVGISPFICIIRGPVGTGKTTLANVLLDWTKKCKPPDQDWLIYPELFGPATTVNQQCERIARLETTIMGLPRDGFYCVVLDNLVDGADDKALEMHMNLQDHCTLFMFLISSKPELQDKNWLGTAFPVHPFATEELKPDTAIAFVKHRLNAYRTDPHLPFIADCELFPFQEDDLRAAVEAKSIGYNVRGGGIITLRQFGQALWSVMVEVWQSLDSGFDIAENHWENHQIDVVKVYQEILDKRAVA